MIHITCDLCGKDMTGSNDRRYVVKISAYAGFDPNEITEDDLANDHMEQISELLAREQKRHEPDPDALLFKGFRFDLCEECHRRFIKDPLNRDLMRQLNFSKN
jgi:hypothetical protein